MNTIEKHVLELIGEDPDAPDVFTADNMEPIRDSINDAIEEIAMMTGCVTDTYHINLRKNRNFYRFDYQRGSIAWIKDVWLSTIQRRLEQTDLIRLTVYNPRWLYNNGSPESYFTIGMGFFGIWPAPSSDTDMLEITVVSIPARYTESEDRIKLRRSWDWAAAHYAVGEYFASRGDAKSAIYHHNSYLKKMGLNTKYPYATEKISYLRSSKEPWSKATG